MYTAVPSSKYPAGRKYTMKLQGFKKRSLHKDSSLLLNYICSLLNCVNTTKEQGGMQLITSNGMSTTLNI